MNIYRKQPKFTNFSKRCKLRRKTKSYNVSLQEKKTTGRTLFSSKSRKCNKIASNFKESKK